MSASSAGRAERREVVVVLDDGDEIEHEQVEAPLHERLAVHLVRAREQVAAVVRAQRVEQVAAAQVAQAEDLVEVGAGVHLEGLVDLERNVLARG